MNIAMHFEIPVTDMTRAIGFYSRVFGITFERAEIDGNEMALFPLSEGGRGVPVPWPGERRMFRAWMVRGFIWRWPTSSR